MSFLRAIVRVKKFAIQNILRNIWLSFVTLSIFLLTLLTVNLVMLVNVVTDATLNDIESRVDVTVYFEPETSEELVKNAQGYAQSLTQVRETEYISAEDALTRFKDRHGNDQLVLRSLEEVGDNPFGPALIISAQSPEDFPFILEAMETPEFSPFIKETLDDNRQQAIENIRMVSERIRLAGLILAGFFGLIAVSIVFNTIRVAIYVHRDEISIMKLVGANDWFVRGPFLMESFYYSVIATGLVISFTLVTIKTVEPKIASFFVSGNLDLFGYFVQNGWMIFGLQFLGIAVLSLATTLIAMRRYLRV